MNYSDYVRNIKFRMLQPTSTRPHGLRIVSRMLSRIGWHFEIANTVLPDDDAAMKQRLQTLCRLPRMSTFAIGAAINRAVSELPSDQTFVNIGVWNGFTFFSGMIENDEKQCIGVDNFSHRDSPREAFLSRFNNSRSDSHHFYESGFRDYFRNQHTEPIGVYVFDGPHTHQDHIDALTFAEPFFAEGCLILIDDTNWSQVRDATDQFLQDSAHSYEKLFDVGTPGSGHPTFWNGLQVLKMTKRAESVAA